MHWYSIVFVHCLDADGHKSDHKHKVIMVEIYYDSLSLFTKIRYIILFTVY